MQLCLEQEFTTPITSTQLNPQRATTARHRALIPVAAILLAAASSGAIAQLQPRSEPRLGGLSEDRHALSIASDTVLDGLSFRVFSLGLPLSHRLGEVSVGLRLKPLPAQNDTLSIDLHGGFHRPICLPYSLPPCADQRSLVQPAADTPLHHRVGLRLTFRY